MSASKSADVGTEEWLLTTGGRLTFVQGMALAGRGSFQVVRERLGRGNSPREAATSQRARVDQAREALEEVISTEAERVIQRQGQPLLNHACRTFLLGSALTPQDVFDEVDLTVAAVASLAHDDGLVHAPLPGVCFTAASADEAGFMMHRLGAPQVAYAAARAAVISHFQPKLPRESDASAQLVALGASADVMGFGLEVVDPSLLHDIWQEWPEMSFLSHVRSLLKGERRRAPRTRPGVLSLAGMPYLMRSPR